MKLVKTESGVKLPATYRSGRFDEWKAKSRVSLPRVGEAEAVGPHRRGALGTGGRKWKHNQAQGAKPLDKLSKDYERKARQLKKKAEARSDVEQPAPGAKGKDKGKKMGARFGRKPVGKVKNELKTVDQIRKVRITAEKKRAKNARPTHRGRKGRR